LSRRLVGLALAAVATLAAAGSAEATTLSYTFDSGNQGWLQKQDQASPSSVPAGFQASGGNPGGHLTAKDSGAEDGCSTGGSPCQLLTFFSPFVPTLGANYGGTGSFDLRSKDVDPVFGAELLLLPSGGLYLDGLIPETAGQTYHHLSIVLNETANWAVCPYAGGACHPPSQAQFMNLIAASDEIAVMADVGADGTGETYDLDNLTLTDGPPPPVPPAPPKKKCKKKKHRKHRAAIAKKCKKKKRHRRVGTPQRLTTGASTAPSRQRS
jgi:hypothetical protein